MSSWDDIVEDIKKACEDISKLDVVTLTGTMTITAGDGGTGLDPSGIWERVDASKVRVVATTRIDMDADTTNFVTDEKFDGKATMLQLHTDATKAAIESRKAALDFVTGMASALG